MLQIDMFRQKRARFAYAMSLILAGCTTAFAPKEWHIDGNVFILREYCSDEPDTLYMCANESGGLTSVYQPIWIDETKIGEIIDKRGTTRFGVIPPVGSVLKKKTIDTVCETFKKVAAREKVQVTFFTKHFGDQAK